MSGKLGNARFNALFGQLKFIEILFPFMTLHNIHTFSTMFPKIEENAKEYIDKRFRAMVIDKLKNDYGFVEPEYFLSLIQKSGCEITGSFPMSCYYGEDWGKTDIDIFCLNRGGDIMEDASYDDFLALGEPDISSVIKIGELFSSVIDEYDPKYLLKYLACNFVYISDRQAYIHAKSKYWMSGENLTRFYQEKYKDDTDIHTCIEDSEADKRENHGISLERFRKYVTIPYTPDSGEELVNYGIINTVFVRDEHIGVNSTREIIDRTFDFAFCKILFNGERVLIPHPEEVAKKETRILGHYSMFERSRTSVIIKMEKRIQKYIKRGFKFPKALYMCEYKNAKEICAKLYPDITLPDEFEPTDIHLDLLECVLFEGEAEIIEARDRFGNTDENFDSLGDFVKSITVGKISYSKGIDADKLKDGVENAEKRIMKNKEREMLENISKRKKRRLE